mmetsp:Transcript_4145/g.6481  ORF Transcript_4145/g.6481 Transcript_4145/m.6481 type:complete len:431 (+) Transcript_4145:160-1452(+)|eukprot:CAMPEP_0178907204 /NCGR_PEP_ID=MMETSP0786-20121207/7241_1 /TAXON_ID=186022 /ORGANISM="Thalassionema frauenfeldii, Strain CCMP 1798" /LENGTH=430 /DNA_ID=CAMNT_0020578977 /DNA_START=129 /DNA_END=1421 /DNA_ORIENTATION=+
MAIESLEIEPLSNEKSPGNKSAEIPPFNPLGFFVNLCNLIVAYAEYYRNVTAAVLACLTVLTVIVSLEFIAKASTKSHNAISSMKHDFTNSHSFFDLVMKDVDHWCLAGGDDDCTCDDPTFPMPIVESKGWRKAFKQNKAIVRDQAKETDTQVDVVFVGDQLIEAWNGKYQGEKLDELRSVAKTFNKKFGTNNGTDLKGLALGIGGDSINNLFWRLRHGEMPDSLNPSVWWITIGGNDLAEGQCSEETVVLGVLRLAEYILEQKPNAHVVINSILPSHKMIKPRFKGGEKRPKFFKPFDLWSSIAVVNDQLQKFCDKHSSFTYFDSSSIFFMEKPESISDIKAKMKEKGKKTYTFQLQPLKSNLISIRGEVQAAGHKAWINAIVPELQRIMVDEVYNGVEGLAFMDDMIRDEDFYQYSDDVYQYTDDANV